LKVEFDHAITIASFFYSDWLNHVKRISSDEYIFILDLGPHANFKTSGLW